MPSLVHQVGGGMLLIRAARGRQRLTVGRYLFSNLMTRVTGRPAAAGDMTLTLSELQVTVGTFSAQLGSYLDIFSRRIYEKLPGFLGRSGQIIVDAGANVGFYTLRQAKAVGPSGHVYAVEPNPDSYSRLERNVAQNGLAWVTCIPKGLSSEEGTMVLDADPRETSTATAHRTESNQPAGCLYVEGTTLDALVVAFAIPRIDVLKMDTEGAEAEIVKGGLRRALPITRRVVMESHNTRYLVRDLLAPLGFRLVLDDRKTHTVYFERA